MNRICNPLFRFKELIEAFLNLDDVKLRKLLNHLVVDMNKAMGVVECSEDDLKIDIDLTYFS